MINHCAAFIWLITVPGLDSKCGIWMGPGTAAQCSLQSFKGSPAALQNSRNRLNLMLMSSDAMWVTFRRDQMELVLKEKQKQSCSLLCSTSGGSHPDSDTGSFLLLRRHCTETKHAVHKRRNRKSTTFSCVVGGQRASENGAEYLSLFPFLLLLCVNVTSLSVCFGTLCGDSGSGTGELLWKTLGFSATVNLTRCENKWTWIERIDLHSYSVSLSAWFGCIASLSLSLYSGTLPRHIWRFSSQMFLFFLKLGAL